MRILLAAALAAFLPSAALAAVPDLKIVTKDGKAVPIVEEDTGSIQDRPLVKTRERLNAQFKKDFLFLEKIDTAPGQTLIGRYAVAGGPLRLTIYEITKEKGGDHRMLRVIATKWCKDGDVAEFTTDVKKRDEDVFFVVAEKTTSAEQLNPHQKYMASQGDALLVKGFGTNWNLSQLKFKLSEKKADGKDVDFAKDADWLASNLIDPQWVVSIRIIGAE